MNPAIIVAVVLVLGGAIWLSDHSIQRRVLKRMRNRPLRTAEQFGRELFPLESASVATKVREILGRHLDLDLSRLSPDDTFFDLEMAELDSMATVGFVIDLEREFGITISDDDAPKLRTVRDVVQYVTEAIGTTKK